MRTFLTRPYDEQLLRLALALSFIYPPLSALADPFAWIGYIPGWVTALLPIDPLILLHAFGVFELALGLWILLGRSVRTPASIAAAVLLFITVTNPAQFLVLFRDLALALAASALALRKTNV